MNSREQALEDVVWGRTFDAIILQELSCSPSDQFEYVYKYGHVLIVLPSTGITTHGIALHRRYATNYGIHIRLKFYMNFVLFFNSSIKINSFSE